MADVDDVSRRIERHGRPVVLIAVRHAHLPHERRAVRMQCVDVVARVAAIAHPEPLPAIDGDAAWPAHFAGARATAAEAEPMRAVRIIDTYYIVRRIGND